MDKFYARFCKINICFKLTWNMHYTFTCYALELQIYERVERARDTEKPGQRKGASETERK